MTTRMMDLRYGPPQVIGVDGIRALELGRKSVDTGTSGNTTAHPDRTTCSRERPPRSGGPSRCAVRTLNSRACRKGLFLIVATSPVTVHCSPYACLAGEPPALDFKADDAHTRDDDDKVDLAIRSGRSARNSQ